MQSACNNSVKACNENRYFRARKEAARKDAKLNSRESAAEFLGISASSLTNYELGVTKQVPPDAVALMADLYNAPELKCSYCAECPVGRGMLFPAKVGSIETVTVKFIKVQSMGTVEEAKSKLLEISTGGKLTHENSGAALWLLDYSDNLAVAVTEIRMACQKLLAESGINYKNRLAGTIVA